LRNEREEDEKGEGSVDEPGTREVVVDEGERGEVADEKGEMMISSVNCFEPKGKSTPHLERCQAGWWTLEEGRREREGK